MYINGYQSDLINYPPEVSNIPGILLTRWFYYSGDLTVARMQLVFTLTGLSFCRFTDGTLWTPWQSTGVGFLSNLTTTDKSSCVGAINELNTVATTSITELSVSGITLTWLDNVPDAHKAIRVGNLVIVNVDLDIDGTYTGTTGWNILFSYPDSLLNSGESFIKPYFTSMMCMDKADNKIYPLLISGNQIWLDSTVDEYHLRISGQMILPIVKS